MCRAVFCFEDEFLNHLEIEHIHKKIDLREEKEYSKGHYGKMNNSRKKENELSKSASGQQDLDMEIDCLDPNKPESCSFCQKMFKDR